jgi:hypothetical protein
MDSRKKTIAGLEDRKREALVSLELIQEELGQRLFERIGEDDFPSAAVAEYRRLRKEAAGSEKTIRTIEADSLRLQTLDETIAVREQERAAGLAELSVLYRELGKRMLADPQYGDISAFYRRQSDVLLAKTETLEARLTELEARAGGNVFLWIGKSAQTLMARSALAKARADLDRLHEAAGEQFSRPGDAAPAPAGNRGLAGDIEKIRGRGQALAEETAGLRDERRRLGVETGADGGPLRHIQRLEQQIDRIRQELKALCRDFGEEAAGAKKRFAALLTADDKQALEKIALIRKTIGEYDGEIEKLQAALAVDAEKQEIARLEKAVAEQRDRIAAAETAAAEFTQKIADARSRIAELSKRLG